VDEERFCSISNAEIFLPAPINPEFLVSVAEDVYGLLFASIHSNARRGGLFMSLVIRY